MNDHRKTIESPWLSEAEAALWVGLSPRFLRKLRKEGGAPPFTVKGDRILYNRSRLDAWMFDDEVRSNAEAVSRKLGLKNS